MKNEKQVIEKSVPDVKTYVSTEKKKFRLRNIIVSLLFLAAFYTAVQGQIVTIPFSAIAIWVSSVD